MSHGRTLKQIRQEIKAALMFGDQVDLLAEMLVLMAEHTGLEEAPPMDRIRLPIGGIALRDVERLVIIEALELNDWVQKDAARFLDISSRVMNYKVAKYEIKCPRWGKNKGERPA